MDDARREEMRKIKDEVLDLKDSPLYTERVKNKVFPVIGEGSHDAAIMFVGEAPGKNEAEQGRPFCGAAGRVLDELLASADIPRKDVYITNIVKDRPPMNRDPMPEEIAIYTPFLDRQIAIIRPRVIATLGRFSMQYIMQKFGLTSELATISRIHGRVFSGQAPYGTITIIPFFHPAMALYNGSSRAQMRDDFKVLKGFYTLAVK